FGLAAEILDLALQDGGDFSGLNVHLLVPSFVSVVSPVGEKTKFVPALRLRAGRLVCSRPALACAQVRLVCFHPALAYARAFVAFAGPLDLLIRRRVAADRSSPPHSRANAGQLGANG